MPVFEDEIQLSLRMPRAVLEAMREKSFEHRRTVNSEFIVALWLYVGDREKAAAVPADGRSRASRRRRAAAAEGGGGGGRLGATRSADGGSGERSAHRE